MSELDTIVALRTLGPGRSRVFFATGEARDIEWKRVARKGTVFEPLADPDYSTKCRIADRGHALRWPDGVDWAAGAVRKIGVPVSVPLDLHITNGKTAARKGSSAVAASGVSSRGKAAARH